MFKVEFQEPLSYFNASTKEMFKLQNPFNCVIQESPPKLQFKVINLQCFHMLKSNYQEKNLMESYQYLPSNEYAQLKS